MKKTLLGLLTAFSLFGCGETRPDANIYVVNPASAKMSGYNLRSDYNADGSLKAGAVLKSVPVTSLNTLQGYACVSPADLGKIKVYIALVREDAKNCTCQ